MNNENTNTVGTVARLVAPQFEMFPDVFAPITLRRGMRQTENKAGTIRFGLLPVRSKNGESIAKSFDIGGAALDAKVAILRDALKVRMGSVNGAVAASSDYTGGSITLRKNGDVAMLYKYVAGNGKMTKEVAIASLTPDDVANIPDEVKLAIIAELEAAKPAE